MTETTDDLVNRLREGCSCNILTSPCAAEEECKDAFAAADLIEALEAKLAKAMKGLEESQEEIDNYIRWEYPSDHPVHERYRKRDYAANPARATLAELTGGKDD